MKHITLEQYIENMKQPLSQTINNYKQNNINKDECINQISFELNAFYSIYSSSNHTLKDTNQTTHLIKIINDFKQLKENKLSINDFIENIDIYKLYL